MRHAPSTGGLVAAIRAGRARRWPATRRAASRVGPARHAARAAIYATARRRERLQHRQVALELPGRDLHAIVVSLLPLDLDVAVEHVLAEHAQDELLLRGQLDR